MKVVDEKGKLFGKLNVIDLIVIIVILAALVVVGVKWLGADQSGESSEGVTAGQAGVLTYTVRVTAQSEQVSEFVAQYVDAASGKKDQLLVSDGLVNAYVVDFWEEPTRYSRLSTGALEVLDEEAAKAAGLVDLCFRIEAPVASVQNNLVGAQEVRVGKTHTVKTMHFEFANGVVEDCVWDLTA